MIDADPQCNATQSILSDDICEDIYLSEKSEFQTIYSFVKPLEEGEPSINVENDPVLSSLNKYNTDIIPGHPKENIWCHILYSE